MANHPRVSEHPYEIGTRIFWYFFSSINFFRFELYIFRYFLPITLLLSFRLESEARLVSSCALAVVVVVLPVPGKKYPKVERSDAILGNSHQNYPC